MTYIGFRLRLIASGAFDCRRWKVSMSPRPLKLHWSPRSPFVRKVVMAAHETGQFDTIELMRNPVAVTEPNPIVMRDNPLNKIPTLILADGSPLYDSLVICDYLDSLDGAPRLIPPHGPERWVVLRRNALADGLLDLLLLLRGERTRPAALISQDQIDAHMIKITASLDRFESEAAEIAASPFRLDHIALGCALAYLDFRFPDIAWRDHRPALDAWQAQFAKRPSVLATLIEDDSEATAVAGQ
jgi:glutathione S-transferase